MKADLSVKVEGPDLSKLTLDGNGVHIRQRERYTQAQEVQLFNVPLDEWSDLPGEVTQVESTVWKKTTIAGVEYTWFLRGRDCDAAGASTLATFDQEVKAHA